MEHGIQRAHGKTAHFRFVKAHSCQRGIKKLRDDEIVDADDRNVLRNVEAGLFCLADRFCGENITRTENRGRAQLTGKNTLHTVRRSRFFLGILLIPFRVARQIGIPERGKTVFLTTHLMEEAE